MSTKESSGAHLSTHFHQAIVRRPAASVTDGLHGESSPGAPDYATFVVQHDAYVDALHAAGVGVHCLDAMEAFPDSVFVEDVALCLPQLAVILSPGAPSRRGETAPMTEVLAGFYDTVMQIDAPATIEGGDILVTGREILVGLSSRTSPDGVRALRALLADWHYSVREVPTPEGVLHFKSDCSLLDPETVLATRRLADSGCFEGYRVLVTPPGEEACANAVRINDAVFVPRGFARTQEMLAREGYDLCSLANSEAAKIDGGLSCLSLRFSPPGAR